MPFPSVARAFAAVGLCLVFSGCAGLPDHGERTVSSAYTDTSGTLLGRALERDVAAQADWSGIFPLPLAQDAFTARIALAQVAERSLDLQYYIWHGDTTGQLLWESVWQAAERGVRVRVLLDDINTGGLDAMLSALDAHPNIEIRLFNPFANRNFRVGDYLFDLARVNRRMHNKVFIADNQVAIVGGRNVGDEYFGADSQIGFQDLDVVAVGPVVHQASEGFDRYWNSASAYAVASLLGEPASDGLARLREGWQRVHDDPHAQRYIEAVRRSALVRQLMTRKLSFEWASARVVLDDPGKVLASPTERPKMLEHLAAAMGRPTQSLDLVSAYFVPGREGTQGLVDLAQQGVQVRVLTNSLAATDVSVVHAGYSKYREELLDGGVALYELKPGAAAPRESRRGGGFGSGSSAASLHAKTFAVDRHRLFVGSFNLDPRSAHLNTEMGVVIDSPLLAQRLSQELDARLSEYSYHVRPQSDGRGLEWVERTPQGEVRHTDEPGAGLWRRLWIGVLEWLPIEWLL